MAHHKGKPGRLEELLVLANAGDAQAYKTFLEDVADILRVFCKRKTPEHTASYGSDDLVQDIMMAVHLKRHTWRQGEPVAPWLFAIARYKAVDAYRRHGRRIHLDIADFHEVLADPSHGPNANSNDVTNALGLLSGRQRDVVSALSVEGRTIGETARHLGVSEGAVRVAFHRGLARISRRFGGN